MNLVLFTGDDCPICHEVEEAFRKKYRKEIDSGEADIVNLDEDEVSQQFWFENELPLAPVMVVVSDENNLITVIDAKELLKQPKPATAGAVKDS